MLFHSRVRPLPTGNGHGRAETPRTRPSENENPPAVLPIRDLDDEPPPPSSALVIDVGLGSRGPRED
jgi:hypothetical protein